MSDVFCVVCGNDWDYYGMLHGDMEKWEADLFRKGAGCPCCKGVKPSTGYFEPKSIFDVEFGDDDPAIQINNVENVESRPKWEKPASVSLWKCVGCGVEILRDANGDLEYKANKPGTSWYHSHPYWQWEDKDTGKLSEDLATPHHTFGNDGHACEFCTTSCYHCGKTISSIINFDDVYDDGWCSTLEGYDSSVFCIDCIDLECEECGGIDDDCDCIHCPSCGHPHSKWSFKEGMNCKECETILPCQNDDCDGCDHVGPCEIASECNRPCADCIQRKCDIGLTPKESKS